MGRLRGNSNRGYSRRYRGNRGRWNGRWDSPYQHYIEDGYDNQYGGGSRGYSQPGNYRQQNDRNSAYENQYSGGPRRYPYSEGCRQQGNRGGHQQCANWHSNLPPPTPLFSILQGPPDASQSRCPISQSISLSRPKEWAELKNG